MKALSVATIGFPCEGESFSPSGNPAALREGFDLSAATLYR